MKIEKSVTDNIKERVNTLYLYMKSIYPTPITKEKVCEVCGVKSTRQARDILSVLAQRKPLISTSDSKGYRLALTKDDLEEVEHTWAELSSRVEELNKRIEPLIKFRDKMKYNIGDI